VCASLATHFTVSHAHYVSPPLKTCKHSRKGRDYRACLCPISVEGRLEGEIIRRSLDVRSWEAAQKIVRDWEAGGLSKAEIPTIEGAMERFISDLNSRGLSREHVRKAELLRDELVAHFPSVRIDNISADNLGRVPAAMRVWSMHLRWAWLFLS